MASNFKLCLPFLRICLLGHKIAATYHFVLTFDLKIAKLRHYDCYFWVVNKRDAISEKPFDRNCEGSEKMDVTMLHSGIMCLAAPRICGHLPS